MTDTELAQIHARLGRDGALTPEQWTDIECLWKEVSRLKKDADQYRLASLGMFDPVRVGQVVAQLQMERDEARQVARYVLQYMRSGWPEGAVKVTEKHPWLLESSAAREAGRGGGD